MKNLVAILRGIKPEEVAAIGEVLITAGFVRIEVPLNSPQAPLESLREMVRLFGSAAEFGAGTVLSEKDVENVAAAGVQFIVSPNCDVKVIAATKAAGLTSLPGAATPSECFAALSAGADALKIFPAVQVGVSGLRALREVVPAHVDMLPVGGVDETQFKEWKAAGASGFGMAGALYRPNMTADEVAVRAQKIVSCYKEVMGE